MAKYCGFLFGVLFLTAAGVLGWIIVHPGGRTEAMLWGLVLTCMATGFTLLVSSLVMVDYGVKGGVSEVLEAKNTCCPRPCTRPTCEDDDRDAWLEACVRTICKSGHCKAGGAVRPLGPRAKVEDAADTAVFGD